MRMQMFALQKQRTLAAIQIIGLVIIGSCVATVGIAYAQDGGTALLVESSTALLAQISLFLGAIGGILGVVIPHLKGKARDMAETVANYVDMTDRHALTLEAELTKRSSQIQQLEKVVYTLGSVSPETRKEIEEYKNKVVEIEGQIKDRLERDTVELEKGRQALSELLKK